MPQTLRGKTVPLTPNLLFNGPKATARCRKAWKQLFDVLHEQGIGAESVTEFQWRVGADKAQVQLTHAPTDKDLGSRLWTTPPVFEFGVDNFLPQVKGLKGPTNAPARARLNRQFRDWIADAVVESFESEPVQTRYSRFNQNGHPFSTSIELSADGRTDSPVVLWSNVRKFKRRPEKKPPREKTAQVKPDYSSGWQRYYFDDGKTRRFWYIQCQGATQTIVEGELGTAGKSKTKKLKSPPVAQEAVQKAIEEKVAEGYIAYAPEDIRYVNPHQQNIEEVQQELVEYEQERGYRLPHEYRRHVLACNGGGLNDYDKKIAAYVSMPGHPVWKKVEVYCILGFASKYDHESLIRTSARTVHPLGHFQFARSPVPYFTIDQQGTVYALNMDGINRDDYDDDGYLYLDRFPAWPVAHSFDEFLTRIVRFPNDTCSAKKAQTKAQDDAEIVDRLVQAGRTAEASPIRRFFFDDGRHQKFWDIELQGKQFTTSHGRFGSSPSATTKKFPTAAAARKASAGIIAQKLNKGYHEVLPGALKIQRPREFGRATAAAITQLEKELGAKLPDQYRHFLETQNGGEPAPKYIAIPEARYGDRVVAVPYLLGLYPRPKDPRSLHSGLEIARRLLPPGHLVVACESDLFTLSLKSKPGCLWYWNHETDDVEEEDPTGTGIARYRPSAARLLANSFDEFLTRIAMYREGR